MPTKLLLALPDFQTFLASCLASHTIVTKELENRDRLRFFDQVGHQTTNVSIGNTVFPHIVAAATILF